jgi:hypothetical protein
MAEVDPDRHVTIRFYHGAVRNQGKSDQAGRPIYDDKEMIEVKYPGDPTRSNVAPAHDLCFMDRPAPGEDGSAKGFLTWAERFHRQYKRWKDQDPSANHSGTPLEHLPFLSPAKVLELKVQNIHTAETLASLSPTVATKAGATPWVAQAKAWLGETESAAAVAQAEAEKASLQAKFDALAAEIQALKVGRSAPTSDNFDAMSDDDLRGWLANKGANPRANAARDRMIAAAREIASSEQMAASMAAEEA